MNFYELEISNKELETSDTITIYFKVPEDLKSKFEFKSGQYLTLSEEIDGKEVRRSYSICTAPFEGTLATTIKRLPGGLFSTYAHSNYKIGKKIRVATPEGKFVLLAEPFKPKTYYFFAAGSGITPILSMIKQTLEEEPLSKCYLLYGNRDEENIIFKEEFDELLIKYAGQLEVVYTLSRPQSEKKKGLLKFFKKESSSWKGEKGRINNEKVKSFLANHKSKHDQVNFYICGPGEMIESTTKVLISNGISEKDIHKEYFSTKTTPVDVPENAKATKSGLSLVKVSLDGELIEFTTDGKKPILDELIAMKKNPPYSCTSGACSSCMAKVTSGKVTMEVCYALDDDEVEAGYILTCQARPESDVVELTYKV